MAQTTESRPASYAGDATTLTLDANRLRYLAEKADGIGANRMLKLVENPDHTVDVVLAEEAGDRPVLLSVSTVRKQPGLDGTAKILLSYDRHTYGEEPNSLLQQADAVFLSQAAVEKFVLPYYMRYKSPQEVAAIVDGAYKDGSVKAVLHMWVSVLSNYSILNTANVVESVDGKAPRLTFAPLL